MTRKIVMIGAAVLTTLLALVVLWKFHIVIVYVLVSLALAAAMRPLATRISGRRIGARIAWIVFYLVAIAGFGFGIFLTGKLAGAEVQDLGAHLAVQDKWILPSWLNNTTFEFSVVSKLPSPSTLFHAITGDKGQLILPALLVFAKNVGAIATAGGVILFLSIYWTINQVHFERLWLSLLPPGKRKQARGIWRVIEPDIGSYIRSQVIQSVISGVLLGLGFWLLGSPYPVFLAILCALACMIPVVGIPLVLVPVLLIGFLTSVQLGVYTVLLTAIVLIAIKIWIKPMLFNAKWDNPILTVVLLIALADAFGLVGIIVAPPISVVCQILWYRLVSHRARIGDAEFISDLKERLARIRDTVDAMEEPRLPLITSSMERLTSLIAEAEPILQGTLPAKPDIETGLLPK